MVRWFFIVLAVLALIAVFVFHDRTTTALLTAQAAAALLLVVFILFLLFGNREGPG